MSANERIQFLKRVSVLIFVGVLPFWPILSSLALIPLIGLFLFFPESGKENHNTQVIWFAVPFLGYATSFLYAYDHMEAGAYMFRILPFLVIPIVLLSQEGGSLPARKALMSWFIYGMLLSSVFAVILSFFNYLRTGDPEAFIYYELAETMKLHPTYYSLYALTALIFLWGVNFKYSLKIFASVILLAMIILLQSRMVFLLLCVLAILYVISQWKASRVRYFIIGILIVMASGAGVHFSKRISDDMKKIADYDEPLIGTLEENGVTQRMWLWMQAVPQISEKPLFGYGLKSQRVLFQWKIHKESLSQQHSPAYYRASWKVAKLNLHNQYLQLLYEGGIFGLLFLAVPFAMIFYRGYQTKNRVFLSAFGMFILILATENLLDRQMGIYYYGVLLPILFLSRDKPLTYLKVKYNRFKTHGANAE